ncbi:MAG: hypothetical protein IJ899_04750 [Blautia sp.]|nr:hypothetical protein [Blautia sp.]
MHVTRTYAPLPFRDLDPSRFEALCMSLLYNHRRWEKLERFGSLGQDDAIDISAVELLENGKRNIWHFQCKRYEKLTGTQIKAIIKDYCQKNAFRPDYYFILTGCNVNKKVRDALEEEGSKNGFLTVGIWSASELETILYTERHDLLFAFFGINMSENRNRIIGSIRRNVALKKRMHKDFAKPYEKGEDRLKRLEEPWRCFVSSEVLIRSIYDKVYPENTLLEEIGTGYYKAEIFNWYHNGLMVYAHPFVVKAKVRTLKDDADDESENPEDYDYAVERLEVIGCIPFENIIEYDMDGDEIHNYPHLYCDFTGGSDPYEKIAYYQNGFPVDEKDIVEILM